MGTLQAVKLIAEIRVGKIERDNPVCLWPGQLEQLLTPLQLPVIMGAVFMYLFAVGGTYFLGIHMGFLAVGAYIAMAGDECARAVGMVLRWKSGKWKSKSLIEL